MKRREERSEGKRRGEKREVKVREEGRRGKSRIEKRGEDKNEGKRRGEKRELKEREEMMNKIDMRRNRVNDVIYYTLWAEFLIFTCHMIKSSHTHFRFLHLSHTSFVFLFSFLFSS